MEKLREQYEKEVIPALMKKFEYKSVMQVPRLDKIVINIGLGDTKENPKSLENAMNDLTQITGQRPMITKAKKSIAAFKLRFQSFRYITTHNTLCQTFYCCCLTYTRFTDQNRVVLCLT